jgi:hypothetical protein
MWEAFRKAQGTPPDAAARALRRKAPRKNSKWRIFFAREE